jgi:hypothetical protein
MPKSSKPQGTFKEAVEALGRVLNGQAFEGYHTAKQECAKKAREKQSS